MEKRTFIRVGLGLGIALAASLAVQLIIGFILAIAFANTGSVVADEVISIATYALFCATYILVFWLFTHKLPVDHTPYNPMAPSQTFGLIGFVFVVGMAVTSLLAPVGSHIQQALHYVLTGQETSLLFSYTPPSFSGMIMTCVFAPVCEEILFRKLLLDRLRPFGNVIAILYSGITFGIFHQNFAQMLYAVALGCMFAYVYLKTNKLWTVILLHFGVNATSSFFSLLWYWSDTGAISLDARTVDVYYLSMEIAFWFIAIFLVAFLHKRISLDGPQYRFSQPITGRLILVNAGTIVFLSVSVLAFGFMLLI